MAHDLVDAAFDVLRILYPARRPRHIRGPWETEQITSAEGLRILEDGPGGGGDAPSQLPLLSEERLLGIERLWVVRPEDVVHAPKHAAVGSDRAPREVKHPNLTGGNPAHCGGEILMLDDDTLIVNGLSGRYGLPTAKGLQDAAEAFKAAGYTVYSMGFDEGSGKPNPFVGPPPTLI